MPQTQKNGYDILQAVKKVKQLLFEQSVVGQVQSSMLQVINATIQVNKETKKHDCHIVVRVPQMEPNMTNWKLVDLTFIYVFEDDALTQQDKAGGGNLPAHLAR